MKTISQWLPDITERAMCASPNMFATPTSTEAKDGILVVHGYQEYVVSATMAEPVSYGLIQKTRVLSPYLQPKHFKERTVLDIGANSGYFSLKALHSGAALVQAIDIDDEAMTPLRTAAKQFNLENVRTLRCGIVDWTEPADIVFALALVHWVYSCTAAYGSVDGIINKLASLTRYMCIVEWVEPEDQLIREFKHTSWNPDLQEEPYTTAAFEKAMNKYFARWEYIGSVSQTRKLYAAFVSTKKREMGGPLPLLMEKDKLISSSMLCRINGIEYWSRVYDTGDGRIIKQATLDLAAREGHFLAQLESRWVPRVLSVRQYQDYSILELEKVNGPPVSESAALIDSPEKFQLFAAELLSFLALMQAKGIVHRDLHMDNVLIKDGYPVIIDFSWSTLPDQPHLTPAGLLETLPEQTGPCDIYSVGKILENLNGGRFPQFRAIHELMTASNPQLRVGKIELLQKMLRVAAGERTSAPGELDCSPDVLHATEFASLLDTLGQYQLNLNVLSNRVQLIEKERDQLAKTLLEYEHSPRALVAQTLQEQVDNLQSELSSLRQSLSFRMASKISALRKVLAPPGRTGAKLLEVIYKIYRRSRQTKAK